MTRLGLIVAAGVCALGMGYAALAQSPAAPPAGRARPALRPGFTPPPDTAGGRYAMDGGPIFKERCAACHDPAVDRAPSRAELEKRTAEDIYDALTMGVMKPMADGLSEAQLYGIAYYLTGKSPIPRTDEPDPNKCPRQTPLAAGGPVWNGWGVDVANSRYQRAPGLKAADVPKLKVKWTFSYPGTKNSQATVFGGRVFVASMAGKIYSLDARTGCVFWRTDLRAGSRASMTVAPLAAAPSKYALYLGDDRAYVRALDAGSGKELWSVRVEDHKLGRITGAPTLYQGVIYVGLSSAEENTFNAATYNCCTFRGSVVALDARTGKTLWRTYMIDQAPRPTRKNRIGNQMYGPAGAAIWSSPTIDAKRGQLYVTTGDSYTEVDTDRTDAVVALDLKSGKIRWATQVLAGDNFLSGCGQGVNCPTGKVGPDHDFGSSSHIVTAGGRDLVITGNKSATVYAMDPDSGKIVWQNKLGGGGALGGFEFGSATDGKTVYLALADSYGPNARPGVLAVDAATGKELWRVNGERAVTCNVPSGRCAPGYSQAVTLIPGALFAGDMNGTLHAFDPATGKPLWAYDTTQPHDTANGVKGARGGSLDYSGPTVAGGMVFVHSGYMGNAGGDNLLIAFSPEGK
jgi:polyvinyl alcohol dehydrogenase (cytochrome)